MDLTQARFDIIHLQRSVFPVVHPAAARVIRLPGMQEKDRKKSNQWSMNGICGNAKKPLFLHLCERRSRMPEGYVWMLMVASLVVGRWIPPLALWLLARRGDGSAMGFSRCPRQCPLRFRGPLSNLCTDCGRELDRLRWAVPLGLMPVAAAVGMASGDPAESGMRLLLVWVLAVLVLTAAWAMLIPNIVTYPGLVLFALLRAAVSPETFLRDFLASTALFAVCWGIAKSGAGLGMGDAKLLAMAAWAAGWPHILMAFWLGAASGMAYLGWRFLRGERKSLRDPVPFVPHLAAGVIIVMVWNEAASRWWAALWAG
jgi:Flp pilus assembly protein protease CpaA